GLYEKLKIEPKISTAYHPQTDGQSERVNQWLEAYLRSFVNHQQDDWAKWLPYAEFCYNNSVNRTTGKTPFQIVYGYNPRWTMMDEPSNNPTSNDMAEHLA